MNTSSSNAEGVQWASELPGDESVDEPEPHYIPTFAVQRSVLDNAFSIARPLWGKARAEWVMCLADDLATEVDDVGDDADEATRREWVAAILWAAALDTKMDRSPRLWAHIVEDITYATGVSERRAGQRFEHLRELGLARPRRAPVWWSDDEQPDAV